MSLPLVPFDKYLPATDTDDPRDALIRNSAQCLTEFLETCILVPDFRVGVDPTIRGRWKVAHCCKTLLLHPDQSYGQMLASIRTGMARLRARFESPHGQPSVDELAARRRCRRSS